MNNRWYPWYRKTLFSIGIGPVPQFYFHWHERCAQCWIEWTINFPIFEIYIFWVSWVFFCATFSFWGMVNFVYSRIWSMWPFICKRLIQTPTSETRVLNPKSCGVHGRSNGTKGVEGEGGGGEAPYQNSYGQHLRWSTLFWKMRNELKQIRNRFSILSIFSFWDMVVFVLKIG